MLRRLLLSLLLTSLCWAQQLHTVDFRLPARQGVNSVHVAGDFNAWGERDIPLAPQRDGSWRVQIELSPGFYGYKFILDGTTWVEDPRARSSRPDGHGGQNSVLEVGRIARAQKRFRAPDWLQGGVAYQIFPERFANGEPGNDPRGVAAWGGTPEYGNFFGGDLQGILAKLDYLQELGVTVLYLNPIQTASSNHKYNPRDYRAVDPHFGGDAALLALVEELHRRDMRIVLDGVFNHTSTDFFAFADARARGEASPYWDWYQIESAPVRFDPPNYDCWSGFSSLPALNSAHPDVRAYLFESVRHWHESFGIDGWRLDAVTDVEHEFWEGLRGAVKQDWPDSWLIGEIWGDPWSWLQGDEFDGATDYRFRDAVLQGVVERSFDARELDARLQGIRAELPEAARGAMLNVLGSHDTARLRTLAEKAAGADALPRVLQAVLLQFCMPGVPCVYYGDEIGLEGEGDPDCRRCFPWDAAQWQTTLLERVRLLGRLRAELPGLQGNLWRVLKTDGGLYLFARGEGREAVAVALNLSDEPRELSFHPGTAGWKRGQGIVEQLGEIGSAGVWQVGGRAWSMQLPASGSALFTPRP